MGKFTAAVSPVSNVMSRFDQPDQGQEQPPNLPPKLNALVKVGDRLVVTRNKESPDNMCYQLYKCYKRGKLVVCPTNH